MYLEKILCRIAGAAALSCCIVTQAVAQQRSALLPDAPDVSQNTSQSSTQTATPPTTTAAADRQRATDDEVRREEKQRILGIMPEFNAVNNADGTYRPLTTKQKFHLFFKSSTDPFIFMLDGVVSGIGQAKDSNPGFHQGLKGYARRYSASYADTFDGNFWGNAVLPSILHEDPRYFRRGHGSILGRALYSASTTVIARQDSGKWGPNLGNVLGNLIAGGISNAYYPADDRGLEKTFSGAATVTAEGAIGAELIEFWPDISHRFFPNHYRKFLDRQNATPVAAAPATPAPPSPSAVPAAAAEPRQP